jgi:hypothetical protein
MYLLVLEAVLMIEKVMIRHSTAQIALALVLVAAVLVAEAAVYRVLSLPMRSSIVGNSPACRGNSYRPSMIHIMKHWNDRHLRLPRSSPI